MRASTPVVTGALVLANLAAYGWERIAVAGGADPCAEYGLLPARFIETGEVATVFTSMFLHDPSSLAHIGVTRSSTTGPPWPRRAPPRRTSSSGSGGVPSNPQGTRTARRVGILRRAGAAVASTIMRAPRRCCGRSGRLDTRGPAHGRPPPVEKRWTRLGGGACPWRPGVDGGREHLEGHREQ
jgi:hypothetical protein